MAPVLITTTLRLLIDQTAYSRRLVGCRMNRPISNWQLPASWLLRLEQTPATATEKFPEWYNKLVLVCCLLDLQRMALVIWPSE